MSAEEKKDFMFIWKIKHLHRVQSPKLTGIRSPSFEIELLKDIEWYLELIKKSGKLLCRIHRWGCSELPERIPVDYQYELTTSDGITLKTSDILGQTFRRNGSSNGYELIELEDRNTPEDVCLRCQMIIPCITPSMKSSPCSLVGWKAETDIVEATHPFELSLKFSDSNKWKVLETVIVENIPIDIRFKYVDNELQIELFPEIEENIVFYARCAIDLKNEKSETVIYKCDSFKFCHSSRAFQFPPFINKTHLVKANCFILKKLNIQVLFRLMYNSSISEIMSFVGDSTTVKDTALTLNKDEANCFLSLQQHLRSMLNENTYADVKLRADDEVFLAHKCLLATRSPVFKAMFAQDMLESKTNIIDIHDVDAKILKYFLEYLYTGTVDDMDYEMAMSLLVVADKYQVPPLTEKCSTFLKSVLCFDNVLNVLKVSDMVNQDQLKVFAVEYIVENATQVLSSQNWPQWVKTNSEIASEIFLKLSKKFDSISNCNKV